MHVRQDSGAFERSRGAIAPIALCTVPPPMSASEGHSSEHRLRAAAAGARMRGCCGLPGVLTRLHGMPAAVVPHPCTCPGADAAHPSDATHLLCLRSLPWRIGEQDVRALLSDVRIADGPDSVALQFDFE